MSLCISITREMCLSLIISVWMVQSPNILRILQCSSAPTLKCFHWFCSPDNNNICFRMVLNPKLSEDSSMLQMSLISGPDVSLVNASNFCFYKNTLKVFQLANIYFGYRHILKGLSDPKHLVVDLKFEYIFFAKTLCN